MMYLNIAISCNMLYSKKIADFSLYWNFFGIEFFMPSIIFSWKLKIVILMNPSNMICMKIINLQQMRISLIQIYIILNCILILLSHYSVLSLTSENQRSLVVEVYAENLFFARDRKIPIQNQCNTLEKKGKSLASI